MKTIWKYQLEVTDTQEISIPCNSKILSVQTQRNKPVMWVLIDPDTEKFTKKFRIYGTDHPIETNDLIYIGTFQLDEGSFIGHVFELVF